MQQLTTTATTHAYNNHTSDFTVNALFYNLNAGAVEDLTGRGLADLRAGLLRTPLPASETFLDGEGGGQAGMHRRAEAAAGTGTGRGSDRQGRR